MNSRPLLTRRQSEVLRSFARIQAEDGLAPTLGELGRDLGLNRATVHGHVQALIEKGALENLLPGASRGLDLTDEGQAWLRPAPSATTYGEGTAQIPAPARVPNTQLPLLGRIAAGGPIEVHEEPEAIEIPEYLRIGENQYLLEVAGDSMQNAGIHSGDLVMIQRDAPARRNDIVVAVLAQDGREECTLKRWHPLSEQRVLLLPENPRYQPLEVATRDVELRGVVRAVIRRLPA